MKKFNLRKMLLLFVTFFCTTFFISCQKEESAEIIPEKDIYLSIFGGGDVVVGEDDVQRDIIFILSHVAKEDIEVEIYTNVAEESFVIENSCVTIPAGEINAKTDICFKGGKFTENTEKIVVRISTKAKGVELKDEEIAFNVKGKNTSDVEDAKLICEAGELQLSTEDDFATAKFVFTLSKALKEDLTIDANYVFGDDFDFPNDAEGFPDGIKWSEYPLVFPKGETTYNFEISCSAGKGGKLPITFTLDDKDVEFKAEVYPIVFSVGDEKVTLSCDAENLNLSTKDDVATAIFNFTLSEAVKYDIELVAGYDFDAGYDFPDKDGFPDGIKWSEYPIVIPAGQTKHQFEVSCEQGKGGTLPLMISSPLAYRNVKMEKKTYKMIFEK